MSWMSEQKPEEHSNTLSVKTVLEKGHQRLRKPGIQISPAIGSTFYLRHDGYWFSFRRNTIASSRNGMKPAAEKPAAEKEVITIQCFSTSPKPCTDLIEHIQLVHWTQSATVTAIRKPSEYYDRRHAAWTTFSTQPMRSMDSVDLDSEQKKRIVKDMEDYLNSSDMYAASGVPYRRGYLFHGPPGTGKTSFIRALAGHLKADICILSLSSSDLNDELALLLVSNMPTGSILLIEDIDSAGLTRDDTPDSNGNFKSGITLAGFLNAIDGIASSQGHILIMTTNFPSKLEDAILRPGRVDIQEHFGNASKDTAKNMFIRMCSPHTAKTMEEVRDLAMEFAEHVDDKKFSPAQIQGFLQQTCDPEKACADISKWVKAELIKCEKRTAGRKIID